MSAKVFQMDLWDVMPSPSSMFDDGDDVEGFFFDEEFIRAWYRAHGVVLNPSRDVLDGDWFPIFGDPCRQCPLREACGSDGCALSDVPMLCDEPEPFTYEDYSQVDF